MSSTTDRIIQRMSELNLSHADLIRGTGAGKATISGWLNGTNDPSAKYLSVLSSVLQTTTTWLLSGEKSEQIPSINDFIDISPIATVNYAPVLSWVQAGNWTDMEAINLEQCEMLPLVPGAGKKSFYLTVRGLSNSPHFEEGEKICIDPECTLEDMQTGEMVVVRCGDKATFKALIVETDGYFLKPLNPDWKEQIIPLKEDCVLVGKYVGSFRPAKRFNLG